MSRTPMKTAIFRGQKGFESLLEAELQSQGFSLQKEQGNGWRMAKGVDFSESLCFPHQILCIDTEIIGKSVNDLVARLLAYFLECSRGKRFEHEWPCCFEAALGIEGLGHRVRKVECGFLKALKKHMGRVARLASNRKSIYCKFVEGLYVFFADFNRAYVCTRFLLNGQRRMSDDPLAPSRSYLKVEEAYSLLAKEPSYGERVVDLGAAPGGWSYSAAKRGAEVTAVDNGPLKAGALNHPLIRHLKEDAFNFHPETEPPFDWMFCDLVEEPHHVLNNLITPWLERGWCRNFVVILKFGRVNPLALLREIQSPGAVFSKAGASFKIRHLYHNREEFTVMGSITRLEKQFLGEVNR